MTDRAKRSLINKCYFLQNKNFLKTESSHTFSELPKNKIGLLNHALELLAVLDFSGNVNIIMTSDFKCCSLYVFF